MRDNEHATKDIIDHIAIVIMLNTTQRMAKNLMLMRAINAKGERELTPRTRKTKNRAISEITIIGYRRSIVIRFSFIAIGQTCTDRRRAVPLRRNARWLLADSGRKSEGVRPQSAGARKDIIINPVLMPTEWATGTCTKWLNTITDGEEKFVDLNMMIKELTASYVRRNMHAELEDIGMRPATRFRQEASWSSG